jgi:hypothetical protein
VVDKTTNSLYKEEVPVSLLALQPVEDYQSPSGLWLSYRSN